MIHTFPENVHVQNPYGLTVFVSKKKTFVLSNPSWYFVLFCCVFYCYSDFSKQHFTKDNNEKKKPRPQKRNHSLPPSKDMPKISPETRTANFNQPASQASWVSILRESRKVTREQHALGDATASGGVRGAFSRAQLCFLAG